LVFFRNHFGTGYQADSLHTMRTLIYEV
jgi:hypothetical protein